MPDGPYAIGHTKRDTLVLQVGGWGLGHEADLIPVKNINCYETLDDSLGDIR
jgi:hypothetical protein